MNQFFLLQRVTHSSQSLRSTARPFTPLVDAELMEDKLRDIVRRQWKNIQKDCRRYDVDNLGQITPIQFRSQ